MSKNKKNYRLPWVLEIGEPKGDNRESQEARQHFHERKIAGNLQATTDEMLDKMMRELWNNDDYWFGQGMNPPREPYPGLSAIRHATLCG